MKISIWNNWEMTYMHVWQKKFINDTFQIAKENNTNYFKVLSNNLELLDSKNKYIPNSLFKFYRATPENIFDISNKVLWMPSPKYFNDPFDCYLSYNLEAYTKRYLIELIQKQNLANGFDTKNTFTLDEFNNLWNSYTKKRYYVSEEWHFVLNNIMQRKSKEFYNKIQKALWDCRLELENKFSYLNTKKIRVSCFSSFQDMDEFRNNILMWSHYTDNHKGFCVEYDMSSFKRSFDMNISSNDFFHNKDEYLDTKMKFSIKAGLFPVIYGSQVASLPIRDLYKAKIINNELINSVNIDKTVFRSYLTKSSNWSYENEWRIIIDDKICKYYEYKIPFPYIKTIFLGCHMEDGMVKTFRNIAKKLNILVKTMKLVSNKFILWDYDDDMKQYEFEREMDKLHDPFNS